MDDALRLYDLTVGSLALIGMALQHRRVWQTLPDADYRLRYGALVLLLVAGVAGNAEALIHGLPGGWRLPILAVAVTWALTSSVYQPLATWRAGRRTSAAGEGSP